ncbi:MAG: rhomboid family intramembrane serine protease [Bacteroidales bacterium]|nr:rhomboid family intramembrane serine protease [Bacteroidales bacterium]
MADYYYYNENRRNNFLSNIPAATKNIIITNVIVFLGILVNEGFMVENFALFYPASQYFRPWQFLTHMFMHGGFFHLFFNMYTLFFFGCVLENTIGLRKFVIFYFVCGLGSAALHTGVQWIQAASMMNAIGDGSATAMASYHALKLTPTVGASGAIYGVLLGYAMLFPYSKMTLLFPPVTLSAKWMVAIFAGIELFTGVTGTLDGVAHFAHLGGMLFGWFLIRYWKQKGTLYNRQ